MLNHDVLDTGISVAELLVAFLGLFVGGYAGSRAGAIARMRVELRQQVLQRVDALYWKADPALSTESGMLNEYSELNKMVGLLPWVERVSWSRLFDFEEDALYLEGIPFEPKRQPGSAYYSHRPPESGVTQEPLTASTKTNDYSSDSNDQISLSFGP